MTAKKKYFSFSLFFLCFFLLGTFKISAQNLLVNGSFEGSYGTSAEFAGCASPYFYNPNWATPSNVVFHSDTGAHSGSTCQRAVISSINGYCYFAQKFTVSGRRTLKGSIWVKADKDIKIDFSLRTRLAGNPAIAIKTNYIVKTADGWQQIEIIGDLGCLIGTTDSIDIDFFVNFQAPQTGTSPVTILLDDASVTDVTNSIDALPNLVTNPGFEGTYATTAGENNGCASPYFYNPNWFGPQTSVVMSKETSDPHSGSACQKVYFDNSINTSSSYCYYAQGLKIPQYRTLKAVIWVKTSASGKSFDFALRSRTGLQTIVTSQCTTTSANWQRFEIIGNTKNLVSSDLSVDNIDLFINFKSGNTYYYIDDASVTDVTNTVYEAPNLLVNSEFDGNYGTILGENYNCASPYFYNPDWNSSPYTNVSCAKYTVAPHSGSNCQKITVGTLSHYCYFAQGFSTGQNKILKAVVWVKCIAPSTTIDIDFALRSRKTSNPSIATATYTIKSVDGWQKLEIIGNTGTQVDNIPNNIDFFINFKSAGTLCIDDAYVSDVTDIPGNVPNLLTNSNFEDDYGDNCIARPYSYNPDWTHTSPYSSVTFTRDTSSPHSGKACQKIQVSSLADYCYFYQAFPVKGQRIFKASAWVKSTVANPVEIDFTLRSELTFHQAISSTRTLKVGSDWQKIEIIGGLGSQVTATQDYVMDFFINFRNTGVLYIDDVSVTDVTDDILSLPIPVQLQNETIPSNFFGMHINKPNKPNIWPPVPNPWPPVDFGMLRLWDSGTKWKELQNSSGTWDFGNLELYLNKRAAADLASQKTTDVIYTLGMPGSWYANGDPFIPNDANSPYKSVANLTDWKNYVTKIVDLYDDKIKYWEIWNEVETFFSRGTNNAGIDLKTLASSAYNIIKTYHPGNDNIVLSPNFTTSGAASDFIYKCGSTNTNYFDVLSFHSYYSDKKPESEIGVWQGYRNMLDNFGLTTVPIWNTEGANTGGFTAGTHNADESCGAVSREYILQWAYGVKNFNWYYWEPYINPPENWADTGTVLSDGNGVLTAGGTAYKQTVKWLTGKKMISKKRDSNNNWVITLYNPISEKNEFIVWNANNDSKSFSLPSSWGTEIKKYDLSGASQNTSSVLPITIIVNAAPLLLVPVTTAPAFRPAAPEEEEKPKIDRIVIYPNPSSGILNVEMNGVDNENSNAVIYNSIGQVVMNNISLTNKINTIVLPSAINSGIYFLQLRNDKGEIRSFKFILK